MDADDCPIGKVLSRRDAVRLLAGGIAAVSPWNALLAQPAGATTCVVRPELTEGPYFLEKQSNRSNIRLEPTTGAEKPGLPLALSFAVSHIAAGACSPIAGATVDVWQCDALGLYSGVEDPSFAESTVKQTFLRGAQTTDRGGAARFHTIYPGWYPGRAVHIHFKIRTQATGSQTYEFTSQLFFPEGLTDQVHGQSPYAAKGQRDTPNARDGIYRAGGEPLLLDPKKTSSGYEATIALALDLADTAVGRSDTQGRRGRGPRGGGPPAGPGRGRGGR